MPRRPAVVRAGAAGGKASGCCVVLNPDGRVGKAGTASTVGIASDASAVSCCSSWSRWWEGLWMLCSSKPRRPCRQSRHDLYGRHRKRCLGGQLLFELEPLVGRPLDAVVLNPDGRAGKAGTASTVGIASDA